MKQERRTDDLAAWVVTDGRFDDLPAGAVRELLERVEAELAKAEESLCWKLLDYLNKCATENAEDATAEPLPFWVATNALLIELSIRSGKSLDELTADLAKDAA